MGLFKKIKEGLKKTRDGVFGQINSLITSFKKVDEELLEELEELLIMGDVGATTARKICDELRVRAKKQNIVDSDSLKEELKNIILEILSEDQKLKINSKPSIVLVIGVNGTGKTTTIGKLSKQLSDEGKKVLLGAADTFRAAAIEQLKIWADRANVNVISQNEGADPAAVVFDTISAAKARDVDVVICDTAGRLHNKKNLMDELSKINRIIDRELPGADKEVLLVLDATTGQNAINQTQEFKKIADITGIVLTKLDGTAKGGVIIAIKDSLNIPVKYIGVGEGVDDLQQFDAKDFASALFDE